jgi:hypothetical protein
VREKVLLMGNKHKKQQMPQKSSSCTQKPTSKQQKKGSGSKAAKYKSVGPMPQFSEKVKIEKD